MPSAKNDTDRTCDILQKANLSNERQRRSATHETPMRDKNGLIPVSSLRLAVHMGPATREVGPHRTAFIGTALSCTLVVDHEGQYWTIAPETGEAAVYTPLPGTRLYTLSDMRLDSLCQLADEIADINPHSPSKSLILLSGSQYFRYKSWC